MFIVIYRPHNMLNCETQHVGPFADHNSAYDFACTLPALGIYREDGELNNPGVKYVEPLKRPSVPAVVGYEVVT